MSSGLKTAPRTGSAEARAHPFTPAAIAWFGLLLVVCYAPILKRLVQFWMESEDMGHGFFVPVTAGYIAWGKRSELDAANLTPNAAGLLLVLWGALQAIVGTLGAELFVSRTAFLFSLIGCVVYLGGFRAIRILAFPLFLLFFMVPIPEILYNQITFPLQLLASRVAEITLSVLGVPVLRDGNILELSSQKLSVVEACSGIRSLLSLSFLSLVYGYFFDSRNWMRTFLFLATVPIAIGANSTRVTLTGLLSEINPDYAQGAYHSVSGWVVFLVALGLLVLVHQAAHRVAALIQKGRPA